MQRLAVAICLFLAIVQQIPTAAAEHRASERVSSLLQSMLDQKYHGNFLEEEAAPIHSQAHLARSMEPQPPARMAKRDGKFSGPLREQVLNSLHLLRVTGAKASLETEQQSDNEFLSGRAGVGRMPKKYEFVQDLKREFQQRTA